MAPARAKVPPPPRPVTGAPFLFMVCAVEAVLGGAVAAVALSTLMDPQPGVAVWLGAVVAGAVAPAWLGERVALLVARRSNKRSVSRSAALFVMLACHAGCVAAALGRGVPPPKLARAALNALKTLEVFPSDAVAKRNLAGAVLVEWAGPQASATPAVDAPPVTAQAQSPLRAHAPAQPSLNCPKGTREQTGPYPGQPPGPVGKWRYCVLPNGFMHGPSLQWYASNALRERGEFSKGLKHGLFERWTLEGWLKERGSLAQEAKTGAWEEWVDQASKETGDPQQRLMVGSYKGGFKEGEWTVTVLECAPSESMDRCPQARLTRRYVHGVLNGPAVSFGPGGERLEEGAFKDGRRDGTWKTWDAQGALVEQNGWAQGEAHGVWKRTCPEGRTLDLTHYSAGKQHGGYTAYFKSGKARITGQFFHGALDGEWSVWPAEGQPKETSHYRRGEIQEGDEVELPVDCSEAVKKAAQDSSSSRAPPGNGDPGGEDLMGILGQLAGRPQAPTVGNSGSGPSASSKSGVW